MLKIKKYVRRRTGEVFDGALFRIDMVLSREDLRHVLLRTCTWREKDDPSMPELIKRVRSTLRGGGMFEGTEDVVNAEESDYAWADRQLARLWPQR